MRDRVIVALDVSSAEALGRLIRAIAGEGLFVKVGMELFYRLGPDVVRMLKAEGHCVFLDLKLHDIPTTVRKAMRGLAALGADMVTVHAAGGTNMMRAALEGLEEGTPAGEKRPLCLAVTQLTSTDQAMLAEELLIKKPLPETVAHYAALAYRSGLDGVVASPWEAGIIKAATSPGFLVVTPGIRLAGDARDDQKRSATPAQARHLGSDYIVVGRSITRAAHPRAAYERVIKEWRHADVRA